MAVAKRRRVGRIMPHSRCSLQCRDAMPCKVAIGGGVKAESDAKPGP